MSDAAPAPDAKPARRRNIRRRPTAADDDSDGDGGGGAAPVLEDARALAAMRERRKVCVQGRREREEGVVRSGS